MRASVRSAQGLLLVSVVFNVIDRIGAGSMNVPAPAWVTSLIKVLSLLALLVQKYKS
jgi:hypothetical protein